ncbi:MAG: hypothetical protein M1835_007197 [Candelina submexicana]|nr:MAG: hypothetical protein M1835_007197 [Candelina submexicana]
MTSMNVEEAMQHARMGIEGDYFTGAVSRFPPSIRSRSPYGGSFDQDPYGGGNVNVHPELGINDTVRSQVHPKICSDGRYPPDFQLPKTVEEVRVLDGSQLDRILQAYRLPLDLRSAHRSRESLSTMRAQEAKLQVLWEFLGATRIAEHQKLKRNMY